MVGNVLATSFRSWVRNFPRFFLLTVIAYVPIIAFYLLLLNDRIGEVVGWVFNWYTQLHPALRHDTPGLAWIPFGIFNGAIAVCIVGQLRDERVSIWRALAIALRHAHWIVAIALLARVATTLPITLIEIARWDDQRWLRGRSELTMAAYAAISIAITSYVVCALPAAAVERRKLAGAFVRAWRVVRGERWKVLVVVLVHYALTFAISMTLFYGILVRAVNYGSDRIMLYSYLRFGIEILMLPLAPIIAAVLFERLRAAKEGPAETQLQRIFD